MDEFGQGGERFYDRDAEAEVTAPIVAIVAFKLDESWQCAARGALLTEDGTVYLWTVRRKGYEDTTSGRTRLAERTSMTLRDAAAGMLEFERDYIAPELRDRYRAAVAAL